MQPKTRKITAIYLRISREDNKLDESYSISNQRKLLTAVTKSMKLDNIKYYVDDGISGTKLDRKSFQELCTDIEAGKVDVVIVKDLSRLSRDSSQANDLIQKFFPKHDIRFISVSECIDSDEGEDEFLGFRTLLNEWYARDISKKRKLTNIVKDNAKEPLSLAPYGYINDPNSKGWIVEPEASAVVKRIYSLSLSGKGTEQIAGILSKDKILTPVYYWEQRGIKRSFVKTDREPHFWNSSTVTKILTMQEYCGDIINLKTISKSFKLKDRIDNPNKSIHKDVHEPIIDRVTWERVQESRQRRTRKRKTNATGEKSIFSGFLICADCGHNLWYHFNQGNPDITYFNCSGYNTRRGDCSTTHYIRTDFLEQVILQEIRRLTKFASRFEDEFSKLVMGYSLNAEFEQRQRKQKELYAMNARHKELDRLFNRMYEDNVNSKLDDERYSRMSQQYTLEQKELAEKIATITVELEKQESKAMTADMFLSTVRKYTRAKKLNVQMLHELIERIEVHQSKKIDGIYKQKLTIFYNCIGAIEIPETLTLPDIQMQTRKGVSIRYEPMQTAI